MNKTPQLQESNTNSKLGFTTANYIIMVAGIIVIALGYILLSGGGSDDPNVFNPAMFDTRRLVVAPVLIILGFIAEIVGILYKKK